MGKKRKHVIHIPNSTYKNMGMEFIAKSKQKLIDEEQKLRSKLINK